MSQGFLLKWSLLSRLESLSTSHFFLLQICNWETFTYQNKDIFQVRRESLGGPTSHEHFTWHCPDVLDLATQTGRSVHDSTDRVWSQVFYLHPLADSYLWRRSSNCSHSSWIANRMKMKPPASCAHISEASQNVPVLEFIWRDNS